MIKFIVMNKNKNDIWEIKELAKRYNYQFKWDFNLLPRINGDTKTLDYRLSPKEIVDLEIKNDSNKLKNWAKKIYQWNKDCENTVANKKIFQCGCGKFSYMISASSQVRLCNFLTNTELSLKEYNLKQVWNKFNKYNTLQKNNTSKCNKCDIRALCQICPAMSFSILHDLNMSKEIEFQWNLTKERYERIFNKEI